MCVCGGVDKDGCEEVVSTYGFMTMKLLPCLVAYSHTHKFTKFYYILHMFMRNLDCISVHMNIVKLS